MVKKLAESEKLLKITETEPVCRFQRVSVGTEEISMYSISVGKIFESKDEYFEMSTRYYMKTPIT